MNRPEEKRIEQTDLGNQSTLVLWDASRKMIGDRWLITLVARIEILIDKLYDHPDAGTLPPAEDLKSAFGGTVVWEQTRQRRFIDGKEKTEVFEALRADFDRNVRPYISHPDFPIKYVLKQWRERKKQSSWHASK